jgi:hypothetical protein
MWSLDDDGAEVEGDDWEGGKEEVEAWVEEDG